MSKLIKVDPDRMNAITIHLNLAANASKTVSAGVETGEAPQSLCDLALKANDLDALLTQLVENVRQLTKNAAYSYSETDSENASMWVNNDFAFRNSREIRLRY